MNQIINQVNMIEHLTLIGAAVVRRDPSPPLPRRGPRRRCVAHRYMRKGNEQPEDEELLRHLALIASAQS